MFDKKVFLYFALAIVGFMLWNAWQKDYGPKPVNTTTTATTQTTAPSAPETAQDAEVPLDRVIEVKTDTLLVTIDKKGGNIVSLRLPKYPTSYETPHIPVTLLNKNLATYYTAQSSLMGNGTDTSQLLFNSSANNYQLQSDQTALTVVLTWHGNKHDIKKTYVFKRNQYDINVSYTVVNNSPQTWIGRMFAEISRRGTTDENGAFGLHTYRGAAISSSETPYEKISYKKMDQETLNRLIKGGWLAMQQRYFVSAWVPNNNLTHKYYSRVRSIGPSDKSYDKIYTIGLMSPDISAPAHGNVSIGAVLYSGPEIADALKQVAPHLDLVIDYGWLWIFSVPIFKVMQFIYWFVGNWGVAIILVTVLIKLLFYKLSETSYKSMARMRELQPRLLALKEKHGDDRQKLSQATMELYKKEKINPLGGCLPMIVQIPVFIALYYVLIESVELRQAPFIFWIHDLSVKDPYYVLPVLMGLSWLWQQKLNPPPPDPVQAKMMMMFPVVFTLLFATFPSGLVLYWIVNNCLSILQQWYIMRKYEKTTKKPRKK